MADSNPSMLHLANMSPSLSLYISYPPTPPLPISSNTHNSSNLFTTMCTSKIKSPNVLQIDSRRVLQPAGNRITSPRPLKKSVADTMAVTPPSPKPKPVNRRNLDPNGLNSSGEKPATPKSKTKTRQGEQFSIIVDRAPGSIAAAQREQATLMQVQRKQRIAHYGRTVSKLEGRVVPVEAAGFTTMAVGGQEEKRCSFITANSDPLYVAYHDEEWGVPEHDDQMLFELLVMTGAQVGSDWTTILKKRNDFRSAFAGFEAEVVAGFTERHMNSISTHYGFDLGMVRGIVDNSKRIIELRRDFGSFAKYMWGFVNHKPIATDYKMGRKIPAKTSKSESISKDLVRRGFRFVGPTVIHSFMQAAGLTNDHLVSCPRHHQCSTTTH